MATKVIIDADPGIGDAVALAVALFDPEIDVLGVTATAGCISGSAASRNVQAIIECLDPPKWPRIGSVEGHSAESHTELGAVEVDLADLHGPSGLGDWEFRVADLHHRHESAKLMIDIVRSEPNEVTLLCLGPLTNVQLACERFPQFLGLVQEVVCLGGAVACGGDITPAAEFNLHANPEAARFVLTSRATKTLVPLDVSRQVVLTLDQYDRLKKSASEQLGAFFDQLLPYAFRAHHQLLGVEGVALNELAAIVAIAEPRWFERSSLAVDVETAGELTRGMSVFDQRGVPHWQANIDVLTEIDVQGVIDYFSRVTRDAVSPS